jgi:hypothetical protein
MNVELLQRVKQHILEEPRRLDMDDWAHTSNEAPCGTQACIAGWACVLTGKATLNPRGYYTFGDPLSDSYVSPSRVGGQALGLTPDEADRLFYAYGAEEEEDYGWPNEYRLRYERATDAKEKAIATADRIDRFIATNGAE